MTRMKSLEQYNLKPWQESPEAPIKHGPVHITPDMILVQSTAYAQLTSVIDGHLLCRCPERPTPTTELDCSVSRTFPRPSSRARGLTDNGHNGGYRTAADDERPWAADNWSQVGKTGFRFFKMAQNLTARASVYRMAPRVPQLPAGMTCFGFKPNTPTLVALV